MLCREYNNFVRPTSSAETVEVLNTCGDDAQKLYLEEVHESQINEYLPLNNKVISKVTPNKCKWNTDNFNVSNLQLFTSVQVNDVDTLQQILDACPDKIKTVDEYGWSLLMIACQANSYEAVKELLKRGVDETVQDKAGNSAQSLIIRSKNGHLANILLNHGRKCSKSNESEAIIKCHENKQNAIKKPKHKIRKKKYVCTICDSITFSDKDEHFTSTVHNINASKGKKIPVKYVIPQSNKGFQIMLKTGWDKETGLGPDGSGNRYPIKTGLKNDKQGLGHEKKKTKITNKETNSIQDKKHMENVYDRNRRMEINFRREFY